MNKVQIKRSSRYFTPQLEAEYLVSDLEILQSKVINILEPSCGHCILVLQLLKKIFDIYIPELINITLIDIDDALLHYSEKVVDEFLISRGISKDRFTIDVLCMDFLEYETTKNFDYIISNPPYQKLPLKLCQEKYTKYIQYLNGQPNIYHLFIIKSLLLLSATGKYMALTPKNYLAGKYCFKIRKWIFDEFFISKIHTFSKRNKVFGIEILQETCITHIEHKTHKNKTLFRHDNKEAFELDINEYVLNESSLIIMTPRNKQDYKLLSRNLDISNEIIEKPLFKVGQIVQFRVKNNISNLSELDFRKQIGFAPLIVARHLQANKLKYDEICMKKVSIRICDDTQHILIPNGNYIFIRKNVDKDNIKLLYPVMYTKELNCQYIALDNNVAYFSLQNPTQLIKLYNILNSQVFDDYYRMINSNHTINQFEIDNINFNSDYSSYM